MQRLARLCAGATRAFRDDPGFSIVLVAVTLVALMGMVALAVDAGAIYAERRELQTGATAAVLAIAEDCGKGLPCDAATATLTAEGYAGANAKDLAAGIYSLDLDTVARTVSVTTNTEDISGGTILAPFFAQVVGFDGGTVAARASAVWGYPSSGATLPLILSDCEWYSGLNVGQEYIFYFHDGNTPVPSCNANPGQDMDGDGKLPGGFGWLDTGGDDCVADVLSGNWVDTDPGASVSSGCTPEYFESQILYNDVMIPYFSDYDGVGGAGSNGGYVVAGFGGFHVTGYNFGGQYKAPSSGTAPCKGDERCIQGIIVEITVTDGELGGEDRGVLIVKLTG